MPTRRKFLLLGSTLAVGTIAGCLGETEELTIGETLNVEGIKVTVDDYTTEGKLLETDGDDTYTPTKGSIYLLTHVIFQNESDTQYELPRSSNLELMYAEEEAPSADIFDKTRGDNGEYKSYRGTYTDAEAVFPNNSFSAWMIYLVPEDFDPAKAKLRIDVEKGDEDVTGVWSFDGG